MFSNSFHYAKNIWFICLAVLFFAFHNSFIAYINSSYLAQYNLSHSQIGLIFAIGSFLDLVLFLFFNYLVQKFSNRKLLLCFGCLSFISLLAIVISGNIWVIILAFILHRTVGPAVMLNLDNLLESSSHDSTTGETRAIYYIFVNLAVIISPVLVGSIVNNYNYAAAYLISMLFLIPFWLMVKIKFKKIQEDTPPAYSWRMSLQKLWGDMDLRRIYFTNLLLQIFFAWTTLFIPLYLLSLGFSWQQFGVMLGISLLPFIILNYPIGWLADKKLGEKSIIITGFVFLIFALFAFTFANSNNFGLWLLIMLLSRIGAVMIETMTDSYFFKRIHSDNNNLIAVYRTAWPLGHLLGALLGSFLLYLVPANYLYLILGIIMLFGVSFSLKIKNTRFEE